MPRAVDFREGASEGNHLVGRAPERATIDEILADARRGRSGAALFCGPAGIGKSTLLTYAVGTASGLRILRTVGVESEMAFEYAGVSRGCDQAPACRRAGRQGAPEEARPGVEGRRAISTDPPREFRDNVGKHRCRTRCCMGV